MTTEHGDTICIYADAKGISHFVEIAFPTVQRTDGPAGESIWTGGLIASGVMLIRGATGSSKDWHRASAPVLSIVVEGAWEIEAGDGERRLLGLGSMLLLFDTIGQGHRSRVIGEGDCATLGIGLGPDAQKALTERVAEACRAGNHPTPVTA